MPVKLKLGNSNGGHSFLWKLLRFALIIAVVAVVIGAGTFAYFYHEYQGMVADRLAKGPLFAATAQVFAAPQEVYEKPANAFVFKFLGNYNLFHARADSPQHGALVRPHEIALYRDAESAGPEGQQGVVSHIGFGGPVVKVEIQRDDKTHVDVEAPAETFRDLDLKRGDRVWFALRAQHDFRLEYAI